MAYDLSNFKYKGNTYTIKDNSALHQNTIGSWMPDFTNLKPVATYEYNIASTSYYKICERPNVAAIKDIADEVLAFRITCTGTNIFSITDVVARMMPYPGAKPIVVTYHQVNTSTSANTGIRYLRTVVPKGANTSYIYEFAIAAYNATSRHIKIEVFKAPSAWTFANTATVYSYNSTYQSVGDLTAFANIGLTTYGGTAYGTYNYANYAGYKSSWDGLFNGQGNFINAGAAIAANQFVFIGKDNKIYPTTSTSVEIDPAWPIVYCTSAYAANAAVAWSAIRSWGYFTPASSILKDGTLVADDTVYMRCTYTNGKLYSANTMTQNLTAGNTYIKLGKMYTATAVSVNTYNSEYFTLDTDGHIKALNGYLFNAAKADTASTVSKGGSTAAGTYGVLFDNNPITSVVPTNTSPRVNNQLTFDPSTGNLTSGIFTGSGAGLTGVPLSSIRSDDPDEDTDVFLSRTATNGNKKYKSAKLVGGTVAFNQRGRDTIPAGTYVHNGEYSIFTSYADHIYLATTDKKELELRFRDTTTGLVGNSAITVITKISSTYAGARACVQPKGTSTSESKINIFDLTLMFGSIIANRIYALETATTGAGVAWFKKYFPKDYYPYNTGTLVSACPTGMASGDVSYKVSPLELNGYPSIDSNDNLAYDGDIRESNGTVTRKWFITKLNGTESWSKNSSYSHTFQISRPYFDVKYWPKSGYWRVENTFAYGSWNTNITNTQIDTIDGGIYTRVTSSLYVTAMSCSTLAEFQAYLAANPIFMGWRIEEFTESTYPFKSPQLVYSGETESFIDDRDVPMPVGQIAEYMESLDAVEDAALVDTGDYEIVSKYVSEKTDATFAYTASGLAFSSHKLTVPIDGTKYKILQMTVFNKDLSIGLGFPRLFIFDAAGALGYIEGTSTYCTTTSAASGITVAFDSSWEPSASTNVEIVVLYRRIS